MSKEKVKLTKAEKKAAKAAKKAAKVEKKAAKVEKKAAKAAAKAAKAEKKLQKKNAKLIKKGKAPIEPGVSVTKKSTVFGHPVRNLILTALVSIILGVLFLVPQVQSLVYLYCTYAVGGLVAVIGLIYIIMYFARHQVSGEYHYEFGIGLIAILMGAYVAVSNLLFTDAAIIIDFTVIVQLIGVAVMLDGILKLQYMLDVGRMRYNKWWIMLITSVLGIALGVGMTFFLDYISALYYTTGFSVMQILGAAYCLNGVLDLISMIVVACRNRKANKAAALAEAEKKVAAAAAEAPVVVEPVADEIVIETPVEEEAEIEVEIVAEEASADEIAEPAQAEPAETAEE